jgi:ankyrin repeat protein
LISISIRTNDDQLTPLHQAASEGHVQCLEYLLAHNADVYVEDGRKQTPVDLAKLWGNKKCAKLLAAAMWHQNKHLTAKERLLSRNTKMADILLEIKREHAILFEEKSEVNLFLLIRFEEVLLSI